MKDFLCIDLKGVAKPWPQKNMYISHTQIQIEMMAIKLKTHKHNNIMCVCNLKHIATLINPSLHQILSDTKPQNGLHSSQNWQLNIEPMVSHMRV